MTVPDQLIDEVSEKALAIYNDKLKSILEPAHSKVYVVIHFDTGDYQLGNTLYSALHTMRELHEPVRLVGMKIKTEPEYGLAATILAYRKLVSGQS